MVPSGICNWPKQLRTAGARLALLAFCVWALLSAAAPAALSQTVRIKDMVDIKGVRPNQLVGYGLVGGLDGTGDGKKSLFTLQSLSSMLEKMGVTVDPGQITVKNVAAVMVTADLPPFAKAGSRIDVLVSSIGDADNLQGGTLLLTPLKGVDGRVYALAQGPVSTGGFSAGGASGSGVQKNFPTAGRVIGGALIEREVPAHFNDRQTLTLSLHSPDFTTASRVAQAINEALRAPAALAADSATIQLRVPDEFAGRAAELVAHIENLEVTPDVVAKVVINERTGTVVMGADVRISTIAIAHGNLSIQIKETTDVTQPLPFSRGSTVVTPQSDVLVSEGKSPLFLLESGVSIGSLVRALNALGVSPRDLIAIMQAIKAAGALKAQLEII